MHQPVPAPSTPGDGRWLTPGPDGFYATVFETYPAGASIFDRQRIAGEALAALKRIVGA